MRELATQIAERGGERIGTRIVGVRERRVARLAGGEGEHGVAGRGVAIDGDAREGGAVGGVERGLEKGGFDRGIGEHRSEEHTSELQSLMRISYAVFCLKKKIKIYTTHSVRELTLE